MKRKPLILFNLLATILLLQYKALSQDTLSAFDAEQKTLELYNGKEWRKLTKLSNQALRNGYNYYYMQMRAGIAYYEQKNYCLAEPHFRKALSFSSNDTLAQEYLYYSYLFTGRNNEARLTSELFNSSLLKKTNTEKESPINYILIEGGTKVTDSSYYYDHSKKAYSNYFKPATYLQLGLEHSIKRRITIFHALTYFHQKDFVGAITQIQYYLKAAVALKKNWLISPSFHYINIGVSSETTNTIIDTLWPMGMPHMQPPPGAPPLKTETRQVTVTHTSKSNYFVWSLAIQKNIKKFTFQFGTTLSNMPNKDSTLQITNVASLYFSPLGNSKLVLGITGYLHTTDTYKNSYLSPIPFIYFQPIKHLAVKFSYLHNAGNNLAEDNGYLINNSPDLTTDRFSTLLNFYATKKITFYTTYIRENKLENIQGFKYNYNIIVAGLKFKL